MGFFKARYNIVKNKQTNIPLSSTEEETSPRTPAEAANGFHTHARGSTWHIWARQNQPPVVPHTDLDWQPPNSYEVRVRRLWGEIIHLAAAILWDSNYLFHVPVVKWKIASKWAIRVFFLPPLTPIWLSRSALMKQVSQDAPACCSHYTNRGKKAEVGSVASLPKHQSRESNTDPVPCLKHTFWGVSGSSPQSS